MKRRGVEQKLIIGTRAPEPDKTLIHNLTRAHGWLNRIKAGEGIADIAKSDSISPSCIRTRLGLGFAIAQNPIRDNGGATPARHHHAETDYNHLANGLAGTRKPAWVLTRPCYYFALSLFWFYHFPVLKCAIPCYFQSREFAFKPLCGGGYAR